MKALFNQKYANKALNSSFGLIKFDGTGKAEVEDDAAEALGSLTGFTVENEPITDDGKKETDDDTENDGKPKDEQPPAPVDQNLSENNGTPAVQVNAQQDGKLEEDGKTGSEDEDNGEDGNKDTNPDGTPVVEENKDTEQGDVLTEAELNKLTVPVLKKMAKDAGIDVSNLNTKQPLIEALLAKK